MGRRCAPLPQAVIDVHPSFPDRRQRASSAGLSGGSFRVPCRRSSAGSGGGCVRSGLLTIRLECLLFPFGQVRVQAMLALVPKRVWLGAAFQAARGRLWEALSGKGCPLPFVFLLLPPTLFGLANLRRQTQILLRGCGLRKAMHLKEFCAFFDVPVSHYGYYRKPENLPLRMLSYTFGYVCITKTRGRGRF